MNEQEEEGNEQIFKHKGKSFKQSVELIQFTAYLNQSTTFSRHRPQHTCGAASK
jgi:hypothetical protein